LGKRRRGRTGKIWLNVAKEDLSGMGVQERRDLVQDREERKEIVDGGENS